MTRKETWTSPYAETLGKSSGHDMTMTHSGDTIALLQDRKKPEEDGDDEVAYPAGTPCGVGARSTG
jgi:hypothetical protein